ncbi:hypothetical protein BGW42_003397 [Actinomortierella wolfii]|nr:hypothetical protein BGW42_003397 [Actinomortierella wolfii]
MALPGKVTIRHEFGADADDVLNVISFGIEGNSQGLEDVANVEGVIGIYPVRTRRRPKTVPLGSLKGAIPSVDSAHILTGVKEVRERLGVTGKGIKVGIIDTGVDYKHPALGGCFGQGCKVAYGYDFVGDDYDNAYLEKDKPRSDKDPMDCAGHGTHVAGIVAARNQAPQMLGTHEFVGVAPDVTIGAYRVFGCEGEVSDDVLLAALKRAYRDGMDIVNLSLGGASGWPEEPFAIACSAYIKKGLHLAIANGNDGEEGLFEDGAPATAEGAIAVGSVDNTHFLGTAANAGWQLMDEKGQIVRKGENISSDPMSIQIAASMAADDNDVPVKSFRRDIAYILEVPESDNVLGCSEYKVPASRPSHIPSHHVLVLLKRGTCSFSDKAKFVEQANLGGMLVYDVLPEQRPLGMAIVGLNISAAGLAYEDAQALIEAIQSRPSEPSAMGSSLMFTVQFQPGDQLLTLRSGGKMSDFSSWGPDARLKYKPDIVSPGGLIYSTFPLKKGGFASLQGTSMASPYMAGVMALYLSYYGKTSPEQLLRLLQLTARPAIEPGSSSSLSSVFQQGAGLVSVQRLFSREPLTLVEPTSLFLNDTQFQQLQHTVSIHCPETATMARIYTLRHRPALSVNGFDEVNFNSPVNASRVRRSEFGIETVVMTPSTVVIRPGETVQVEVRFEPPTRLRVEERWLVSGYLELECKTSAGAECDAPTLSYGGMHGRLSSLPILNPMNPFPALELEKQAQRADKFAEKKHDANEVKPEPRKFRDRSQELLVGKDEEDWVRVLISVNFPTELLTIEVESVCDDARGGGEGRGHGDVIRLEIGGEGPSRFQIESPEELARQEEQLLMLTAKNRQKYELSTTQESLELRKIQQHLASVRELAFMPSGLYQPYKSYSRFMVQSKDADENNSDAAIEDSVEIDEAASTSDEGDIDTNIQIKHGAKGHSRIHASDKGHRTGGKKVQGGKAHGHKKHHGHRDHHHHHHHHNNHKGGAGRKHRNRGEGGRRKSGSTKECVPRILGLIPNGYNPWTSRTDSSEENQTQMFTWLGDLLIENHAAMDAQIGGPDSALTSASTRHAQYGEKDRKKHEMKKSHHKKKNKEIEEESTEGQEETRNLPDGRYRLIVKAIKPWGVRGHASDVERWSSPVVSIKRRK